jgi:hypothetical protein
VPRHRNRGETLDRVTDVLMIGGGPLARWAAVGATAVGAHVNSAE